MVGPVREVELWPETRALRSAQAVQRGELNSGVGGGGGELSISMVM